jgi:phosphotriesterase-related protein
MHEHILTRAPGVTEAYPETYPRAEIADSCVAELTRLRTDFGVTTIVDHTTIELGRDPELVREISVRSGVNIVVATGSWAEPAAFYQHQPAEYCASLFARECKQGIAGTGIKAGIIKCAIDTAGLTPFIEKMIRSAALAQAATGLPVTVHSSCVNKSGLVAAQLLRDCGADMPAVIIGHAGDTDDFDYLYSILDTGAWLGIDRLGIIDRFPDEGRVRVIARLCAEGLADRIFLSHDASCWSGRLTQEYKRAVRPDWNFRHFFVTIAPQLRAAGVAQSDLDLILTANPRTFFERRVG